MDNYCGGGRGKELKKQIWQYWKLEKKDFWCKLSAKAEAV
jgi:hypothetical protein